MRFSTFTFTALFAGAFAAPAASSEAVPAVLEKRGKAVDYTQNYVAGGASVSFSPNQNAGSFSINFNTRADFVCGLGWRTGDSDPISFSGSFSGSGVAILSVYGWTTNPLVEYYIMENPTGYPRQGTQKGSFTSDGATYEVWEHQQTNQPSIQGTSTFQQYISIRTSARSSGTVTVANHFAQWAKYGMNLGSQNYQTLSVESWSGSGQGSLTVSKGTSSGGGGGGGGNPTTTSSAPATTTTASGGGGGGGGSCAAIYGQCGGQGWTGATCCSSGTCKSSNPYYSQCL